MKVPVSNTRYQWIGWMVLLFPVLWAAILVAQAYIPGQDISQLIDRLNAFIRAPSPIKWTPQTPHFLMLFSIVYLFGIGIYYSSRRNRRPKEEHGCSTMIKAIILRQWKFGKIWFIRKKRTMKSLFSV